MYCHTMFSSNLYLLNVGALGVVLVNTNTHLNVTQNAFLLCTSCKHCHCQVSFSFFLSIYCLTIKPFWRWQLGVHCPLSRLMFVSLWLFVLYIFSPVSIAQWYIHITYDSLHQRRPANILLCALWMVYKPVAQFKVGWGDSLYMRVFACGLYQYQQRLLISVWYHKASIWQ